MLPHSSCPFEVAHPPHCLFAYQILQGLFPGSPGHFDERRKFEEGWDVWVSLQLALMKAEEAFKEGRAQILGCWCPVMGGLRELAVGGYSLV